MLNITFSLRTAEINKDVFSIWTLAAFIKITKRKKYSNWGIQQIRLKRKKVA